LIKTPLNLQEIISGILTWEDFIKIQEEKLNKNIELFPNK